MGLKSRKFGLAPSANLESEGGHTLGPFSNFLKSRGHLVTGVLSIYKFNNKRFIEPDLPLKEV